MKPEESIRKIIGDYAEHEMPSHLRAAFGRWLLSTERRQEKEQELYRCWQSQSATATDATRRNLARLHTQMQPSSSRPSLRLRLWRLGAVAAALLLLVGGNYLLVGHLASRQAETRIVASNEDCSEFMLPDSSIVWLNRGSRLRYKGSFEDKRLVVLDGEAFFRVHRDVEHPFVVETPDMDIEVLGTEFDVIAYADGRASETVLCRGSVRVSADALKRAIVLDPGQRIVYSRHERRYSVDRVDTRNYSQWMLETLQFENRPLSDVLLNLERRFAVEIACPDEFARSIRLSLSVLRSDTIEGVLNALSPVIGIRYVCEGRRVTIFPEPK